MLSSMNAPLQKNATTIAKLFNEIASGYDKINSVLSFGLDKRWRSKCASFIPEEENFRSCQRGRASRSRYPGQSSNDVYSESP